MKSTAVKIALIAASVGLISSAALGDTPSAPGRYADWEVLSYSTSTVPSGGSGTRRPNVRLGASLSSDETETWVVRSPSNTNRTFAVRRARLASGGISMCAYSPNRVLATLAAGKSYATFVQEMAARGLHVVRELMRDLDGNAVYIVEAAETENDLVEQMTMSIESTGSCSYVCPDYIYEACVVPNDTNYSSQWALEKIGASQAWDTRTDASSVLMAVLDTGVNYDHFDLNQNLWINVGEIPGDGIDNDGNGISDDIYGMACIGGNISGNPMDDVGHGSHCAGIIGASGNNRRLISGVVWKAKIMALKFLDSEGYGSVSDAITCLRYAEDHGVKVVNCSFGMRAVLKNTDLLETQMQKMSRQGTIFVCAAGNADNGEPPHDNDDKPFYPANFDVDTLIAVAATDQNDALANFSYYGAQNVDIAAPGVDINSTVLGSQALGYKSGTSMATPHVTGALALLMAHYPGDTPAQIIDRLYAAAEPVPALAGKVRTGARLSMAGFFGIAPPTEISVSQGTVNDAVVLYWTAVSGGTHYRVWRSAEEGGEKTMLGDWRQGLTYSDETAEPGVTYWYYLQAASSAEGTMASTFSDGVSGYRPAIDASRITVSFNPAGGTVTPASKVYRIGETYSALPTPAYSGKAFLGWFTAASGGTRLDEPSIVRADATTLHAHWIASDALRVENLFARQRYPWNGYVDVTFDLFGVPNDETASVSLTAQEEGGNTPLALRTFVGPAPTNLVNGAQHVVWNATPDTQGILYTNLILAATVAIDEKPLLPPANVSASNATDSDAVVVSWSASENATSYEVWRSTANNPASASKIASPSTTSYRDTSAVPATTYRYWVKAVNSKKTSEFSASASGSRKRIATGIAISGSASVTAGGTATYTCTATYNDSSTASVTPTWSITSGSSYASISSSGVLSANGTATQRSVTIQASYSYNGSTQTMTKNVTINTRSVTISFNANGGSVSPTSQSYTSYGTYGSLPTPSARTGYTFVGWFTDATGGTQVTTAATVPASATTLWAHWTANTYTVTLDRQSGSGGSTSATATYGSAMPSITVPTRTGYTFGGYYTSTGGGGTQYYTASGTSVRTWDRTSATTLYAKWTANTYTVTLDRQSGSGGSSSVTVTYDSDMPSITPPTRSNYTFGGYYTSTGGSGTQYYTASGASARKWDITANTTLYAKWTINTCTVSFNANGGTGTMTPQTVTIGSSTAITPCAFTRDGYAFMGWATSSGGSVVYTDGVSGTFSTDTTLYAVWSSFSTALDNTSLSFTTGGDANWTVVTADSYSGGSSARSGAIDHRKSTWLQTQVTGAGVVQFWYKISSESSCDKMTFYIDDVQKTYVSGDGSGWNHLAYSVTNNVQHTFKWVYSKDGSVNTGSDCCWIDKVEWTRLVAPSGVTASQDRTDGILVSWTASAGATSYEIYRSTSTSTGSATKIGTSTTTSYNDTTALGERTYYYWVKAVGCDDFSSRTRGYRIRALESVEIDGPDSVMSECGGYYTVWLNFSDGTRVGPQTGNEITISTNQYATLSNWGNENNVYYWTLTGKSVDSRQYVYMSASYTYNGVTQTASKTISVFPAGNLTYTYRTRPDGSTAELTGYKGDTTVTELTLPSSINGLAVTRTSGSWMRNLSSLTRVTIPSSFTEVAGDMFYYCQRLTNVTIPNSVTNINSYAFYYCTSLTSVSIPNSVCNIGYKAFCSCFALQQMRIPSSVKTIESYAFYKCTSLWQVVIPDSVTSIGDYAFQSCTSLTSITIPDSVTRLYGIFSFCYVLQTVNLSANLRWIDSYSFAGCTNLSSIAISGDNTYYKTENGILFNKAGTELVCYPANKAGSSYTVPSSVNKLLVESFCDCQNLTNLTLPASVTDIESSAIYNCPKLQVISVATANPSYRSVDGILYNKNRTTLVAYPSGKTTTSYVMPDSVRWFYNYALFCPNINSFVVSDSVKDLCLRNLSCDTVKIPPSVTRFARYSGTWKCLNIPATVSATSQGCSYMCYPGDSYQNYGNCDWYFFGDVPNNAYFWGGRIFRRLPEALDMSQNQNVTSWNNPILCLEIDGENKVFAGCSVPLYAKGSFESGHFGIASKADWMVASGSAYASINPSNGVLTANADVTTSRTIGVYAWTTLGGASAYANTYNVQIVPANTNRALIAIGKYAYNRLRWLPYPNAVKYNIRRGTSSAYANATVIDTYLKETLDGTETFVDDTAAFGTTYYYWVEALDTDGNSLNVTDAASATRATGDLSKVRNVLANYELCLATNDMQRGVLKEIAYWKGVNSTWMTHIQNNNLSSITGANEMFWRSMYDLNTYISECVKTIPAGTAGDTYCVIDLSGGPNAESYPVKYFDSLSGGFNTDAFKTTRLVLRKIPAGSFTMGCATTETGYTGREAEQHTVSISQPFYMGVFEVTQKQYDLVMGSNPSSFKGDKRPVENLTYNAIRGSSAWPASSAVSASSFMGKLRAKTGISTFDLPTEAKWEYACRAGKTTALNNGKNLTSTEQDANMGQVGRYGYNSGRLGGTQDGKGGYPSNHTTVGSYASNNWGLYDMHGNVWEWTLDWFQARSSFSSVSATDPSGPTSGSKRVLRGGCWGSTAQTCRSAYRGDEVPSSGSSGNFGFRLSCSAGQEKVQLWEDGPYWATRNIGAEKPEDYGYYFWWGDTVGYKREGDSWVASAGSS